MILAAEALLFIPGLPAWDASPAARTYLLCVGLFSGAAVATLTPGKRSFRTWGWAAAAANLPIYPTLTPVGVLVAVLLLAIDFKPAARGVWPALGGVWWTWIPALAFCWIGAWNVHRFAQVAGLPEAPALLLFGGLWLAMPLSVLVHQAGHWLAGRQAGLGAITAWSGWADPQPAARWEDGFGGRLLLWTVGGPLASLAIGASLLAIFITSPGTSWEGVGELAGLSAICSLAVFLVSILPWRVGGYRSDGAVLLAILYHGAEFQREKALALLAGQWAAGTQPRDWNPDWLRVAAAHEDLSRQHATACGLNYLYCLDQDFASSARYWAGRLCREFAADLYAVPVRWRLEMAYHLAAHDCCGRVWDAESWLKAAGRGEGAPYSVWLRSEAAVAVWQRDAEQAAELIRAAEHAVLGQSQGRFWEFEMRLLARLRDSLDPSPLEEESFRHPVLVPGLV